MSKPDTVAVNIPPGHYYSPIVDPAQVGAYVEREKKASAADLHGIDIRLDEMREFWARHSGLIASTPFTEEKSGDRRFFYKDSPFPYGDAVTLRLMIGAFRPRRMIEIGSGFSSACALDSAEEFKLGGFRLTCIEPDPGRLRSLLRPEDRDAVEIMQKPVQEVDCDVFRSLQRNDILFIDSSHALKTGSDVHYELFHILPVLAPGVLVHFHDCRWPFEYPDPFIFERNYSWNEAYAVRAFLMWNRCFRVLFYGGLLASTHTRMVHETYPPFLKNHGSSLWVVREA